MAVLLFLVLVASDFHITYGVYCMKSFGKWFYDFLVSIMRKSVIFSRINEKSVVLDKSLFLVMVLILQRITDSMLPHHSTTGVFPCCVVHQQV